MVMRGRRFILPALLVAASNASCSNGPLSSLNSGPTPYSCALADAYSPAVADPSAPSDLRHRSVTLEQTGGGITLQLGSGDTQYLDPVAGGGGRLFANASYGWRVADSRRVLTDIQNVRTYNCDLAAQ
jgi:hypothetical protein